jgi:hypothetical protein
MVFCRSALVRRIMLPERKSLPVVAKAFSRQSRQRGTQQASRPGTRVSCTRPGLARFSRGSSKRSEVDEQTSAMAWRSTHRNRPRPRSS